MDRVVFLGCAYDRSLGWWAPGTPFDRAKENGALVDTTSAPLLILGGI